MTSTNDGKEVKNNPTSSTKGKAYYIELYKSLDARLSEAGEASERTKHLCSAWRSVHSLCRHSAPSTHEHLRNWLQKHTARTILQTSWQKPEREDDRRSLEAAINDFISSATSSANGGQTEWESMLVARGEWFKRVLQSPWDHPVLTSLLNASGSPPTDDEVLTWLKEERGMTFVARLHTLVRERCDDIAVSLATALMVRVRAAMPPVDDSDEQSKMKRNAIGVPPAEESCMTFGEKLNEEADFTKDVWESITDIEFVLLHKRDSKQCIALAKQFPLMDTYHLIERLQKRLEASPQEKRLWKNAREVATLIAQVAIARCMVVKTCQGGVLTALYGCVKLLAGLLTSRLAKPADALAAQAPTARHLHTMAFAVDKQLSHSHAEMKPYVCELYVRAITAGMNELEKLKLKTEKETEARTMESTLASWFLQLGSVLSCSDRIASECALTAFSLQPSQTMFERIEAAPLVTAPNATKEEPITTEFGSWANDSRSQTNLVKTSETLNMKQTQNQTNVLSTAILNEGEALGLSTMLCQDIAVLLSGPRVKTLSWDMDRSLLLENCRSYMEKTHGGTRVPTRELKYLNIDLKQYQHLPEEKDDDENDPYYGIERGYEHLAVLEEPEDIWADVNSYKTESTSSIEDEFITPRRKKKTKRTKIESSSEEDSDKVERLPLSMVAEAKRAQKKKERPHSKERSKERAKKKQEPVDPLGLEVDQKEKPPKEKKERKKRDKVPKVIGGKRSSLAKLLGIKVETTKKRHKEYAHTARISCQSVAAPVTDSDYDSQGKNSLTSLTLDDFESLAHTPQKKETIQKKTTTLHKPIQSHRPQMLSKMQYRPQIPYTTKTLTPTDLHSASKQGYTSFKQYHDETKANLCRLLEHRKQKNLEKKLHEQNMTTKSRLPAILRPNIPPLQTHISPKAVAIPEIPKSYISKDQVDKSAEILQKMSWTQKPKNSVIQYGKNSANKVVPSAVSTNKVSSSHPKANSLKMADIVHTPYDQLMAEIAERQTKQEEAYFHQNFQHFVQTYEPTRIMPHPEDFRPKQKKPMPVSRVEPVVPNVPKVDPKPVQCAKQQVQQRKPEPTLNTFSRLSYMHKNKQNELKVKTPVQKSTSQISTYEKVSNELDEIMKEHQRAQRNVIQAKREREQLMKRSQESFTKCDTTTHPLLSGLLNKSNSDQLINRCESVFRSNPTHETSTTTMPVQPAVPTKTYSAPTAGTNTSLSQKDQNDLWDLLKQRNKLNNISQYATSVPPKPTSSAVTRPQTTQYKTVAQNRQQFCQPVKTPGPEDRGIKSTLENQIINVMSNTLLKPGTHEVNKYLSVNIKPPSTNKPSDKHLNPEGHDKLIKNLPSKVIVEKLPVAEKPEWQTVMQDILKLKTPCRESQKVDVPLRKSSFESPLETSLNIPKLLQAQPKLEKDKSIKHQEKVDRPKPPITSIQNVMVTKKGIKVQDVPHLQKDVHSKILISSALSKKPANDMSKKVPQEVQRKQFTYAGPRHVDPFISGIPNADYDLLDELMDDDLRKEIGELSSDEESYTAAAQSFLKPVKQSDNKRTSVLYNKCEVPRPATEVTSHSSIETPPVTIRPVSQCANKITQLHENNQPQKAFSVESILASPNATRVHPASRDANEACRSIVQNVKHTFSMKPNDNYMSAVPQQAHIQNVVVVGSDVVYGGYSAVQAPVQTITSMTPNYVAVSNTPMALYQTHYTTPVVIGATVSVPVINNVSVISVQQSVQNNIALNTYTTTSEPPTSISNTQLNSNVANETTDIDTSNLNGVSDYSQQNHKSQNDIKSSERKVLSEVQEFATSEKIDNASNQIIRHGIIEIEKKNAIAEKERLKKKRLAILNREIYHRCGEKTIPLTYSPIPKTQVVSRHESSKATGVKNSPLNTKADVSERLSDAEGEKLLEQIKNNLQNLSDAINEVSSPSTPDSIESKENKSTPPATCRRILLRSSNKMAPKANDQVETPLLKKTTPRTRVYNSEAQTIEKNDTLKAPTKLKKNIKPNQANNPENTPAKLKETLKTTEIEKNDITPTRVSKRIRNKKAVQEQDEIENSALEKLPTASMGQVNPQAEASVIKYFDIEAELQGSVISKSISNTAKNLNNDDITEISTLSTSDIFKQRVMDINDTNLDQNVPESMNDKQTKDKDAAEITPQNKVFDNDLGPSIDDNPDNKCNVIGTAQKIYDNKDINNIPVCKNQETKKKNELLNCTIAADDKIRVSNDKICANNNTNVSVVIPEITTNSNSQVCNEVSVLTPNVTINKNGSVIKSRVEESIITTKVQTANKNVKDNDSNDSAIRNEAINTPEKTNIDFETRETTQQDDIDLDMSVTCDESTSKSSLTLGNVITARMKPINSEQNTNKNLIKTRSRSIIQTPSECLIIKKKNDHVNGDVIIAKNQPINSEPNTDKNTTRTCSRSLIQTSSVKTKDDHVNDDIVVISDNKQSKNTKENDTTTGNQKSLAIDSKKLESCDTPTKILKNILGAELTPKKCLVKALLPELKTVNTDTSIKRKETPLQTFISTDVDENEVVIIDDDAQSERKANLENTASEKNQKAPNPTTGAQISAQSSKNIKSTAKNMSAKIPEAQKERSSEKRAPVDGSQLGGKEDFKEKICIIELPCDTPDRKKIRVTLPNGRKFKATVHGNINVTYDTLFTLPSIRNAMLNGLDCKKLIATVDINNPDKILSAEVFNVQNNPNKADKAKLVDTIDLLSDEEDSLAKHQQKVVEENEFVIDTEIGKLKIPPMNKELFIKHKKQLKLKSQILLQKLDISRKIFANTPKVRQNNNARTLVARKSIQNDAAPSSHKNTNCSPVYSSGTKINVSSLMPLTPIKNDKSMIPNQYLTGLLNDIRNKLVPEVKEPKISPEVLEIDDSFNDSIDVTKSNDTKPENKTINLLKDVLLKELGVGAGNSENKIQEKSSNKHVQIIQETKVNIVKTASPAKKRCRRKVLKLSTLPAGKSCRLSDLDEEDQLQLKRRKCTLKLIRCADMARIHEKEIVSVEKKNILMDNEPLIVTEEFSILNSLDNSIAEERASSPVIEWVDVFASLEAKFPECHHSIETSRLSCQSSWFLTKYELHVQSKNDVILPNPIDKYSNIGSGSEVSLDCEMNWLSTKAKTRLLCGHSSVTYTNAGIDDKILDVSRNEKMPLTCEANWLTTKPTLHTLGSADTEIRFNITEDDQEMRDFSTQEKIAPLRCEASWLASKPILRMKIKYNTPLSRPSIQESYKEICDISVVSPLSCEANWLATKPIIYSLHNVTDLKPDLYRLNQENNNGNVIEEVIPLTCEANWLNTKPNLIHLQRLELIKAKSLMNCTKHSTESIYNLMPVFCNSHWFMTKAELHEQHVAIVKINDHNEAITHNITPLSCNAKWLSTKVTIRLEALNNAVVESNNYLPSSTLPCQTIEAFSLVSKALKILQDASVINQYKMALGCITHSKAIPLKRRLPRLTTPAARKIKKLNSGSVNYNINPINSNSIDINASDVKDLSSSIFQNTASVLQEEIQTAKVETTLKRAECITKCGNDPNVNQHKDKTRSISSQDLNRHCEISDNKSAEQTSTTKSCDENKRFDIISDANPSDSDSVTCDTSHAETFTCTVAEIDHCSNTEKNKDIEIVTDYCDDIESNLAKIVGEPLKKVRRKSIHSLPVELTSRESAMIKNTSLAKEIVEISESENVEQHVKNVSLDDNDIEADLSKILGEPLDNNSLDSTDLVEVEIIDDWEQEVVDKSLANEHEKYANVKSIYNQGLINHMEERPATVENNEICVEDPINNIGHMYVNTLDMQPLYEGKDDNVVIYVPTEGIFVLSGNESVKQLEEKIVDMSSTEIVDDFTKSTYQNTTSQAKEDINKHTEFDDVEVKLAAILGESAMNGNTYEINKNTPLKNNSCVLPNKQDVFTHIEGSQDNDLISNKNKKRKSVLHKTNVDVVGIHSLKVKVPKFTYAGCSSHIITRRRSLKRKMDMSDVKTNEKKYRKGKNIDYPKFTAVSLTDTVYVKEFKRIIDYCSTVKFSYSLPFHKESIDVHAQHKLWPILDTNSKSEEMQIEVNEELFADVEKSEVPLDPLKQTLVEELNSKFDENTYKPSNIQETNFSMGFGERSGRVIQESLDGEHKTFSAATLSDVKQLQPLLPSDVKETRQDVKDKQSDESSTISLLATSFDQKLKAKRFVDHLNLRQKVRAFFEKSKAELNFESRQTKSKKHTRGNDDDNSDWPFGDLTSTRCFRPSPVNITVNVVQVGQLPVSAAAQNPVTCDPRVTHVSNASPSQCSPENSIGDELQTPIKTEYTELTTADLTLPMMQEYVTQHHTTPSESQEPTNVYNANSSINEQSEMKSVVKIELMEETSEDHDDDNMSYEDTGLQQLPNGIMNSNVQYQFDNAPSNMMTEPSANTQLVNDSSSVTKAGDPFNENKESSGVVEKRDQLVHAMCAAGITTTTCKPSDIDTMPQNPQPNITISQANTNNFPRATPINAIALQQALAQILPPSLNQVNSSDNNPQAPTNPQVLHIVQGNSQSVINKPNGTQLLHIVQNKNAVNSNAIPSPQQTTFSGLSLVDGALQQGGNHLLHIVNAANQKNANAGQLLKRVNLLTNLANVQGANEQKMVQFVCKSADGKPIQLPHQRSMVLRLQPLDPATVPTTPKQNENQDIASSSGTNNSVNEKETSQSEMKSRSLYEENYAKFVQNDVKFTQNGDQKQGQEKATSLPKFNQVFGKQVYQDKQDELETENLTQNTDTPEENNPPLEQINEVPNPQMLIRKPNQTQPTHVQPNLVQQIKQTIGPMNIQTMHGGVIYTRQIPVNIGNGQTINLITVPSTELVDDSAQKQQSDGKFGNQDGDPPIIKIVPTNQTTAANGSPDENNSQLKPNNEGNPQPNPQPQPQPVLTQMRIKLPMLSKAPQMVGGTRVVRPSFFQIQRNVIGGANQQVFQQLVLTAAPPMAQSVRLPAQVQKPKIPSETQSSPESQMSSSTLEQLREFDMVLEQVKERSTVQPGSSTANNNFTKLKDSPDTTDSSTPSTSTQETAAQVHYSVGNTQSVNMVNYVTRKSTITSTTTTSFVRSPDSTGTVESPSSSTHSNITQTVTSDSCASSCASEAAATTVTQPKPKKKKPKPSTSNSNPFNIKNTPKPSSQKPLEDEQTTQRILYILAEYKEQVENSPDKDKPAPRRRNNPAAPSTGSSKRKKSSSGSRRRDMSPVMGEDSCRTMGSEDSSCGTSLGECNECLETHSPEESPKKVVRRLTFEQETQITQTKTTTTTTTVPQRNVIVTDGQAFAVRGPPGKPATTVLMPANYLLPVSMVKGGQQIAIVTNRGPKLLVGAGEGGTGGTLLFQRLIGPGGLKPVLARPGVRHIRLPTAALHNLQAFNIATPASAVVPPPDSTASPAPAPTPPDLVDTRAMSSPWPDRDAGEVKPERGNSSPEGSEPWNLPSSSIADDYGYEEIVRTDNMDRTVLDAIPDRYSPDLEAQRIFDKMFDSDSKKSMYSRCGYDIDASDDDKAYHQVVHRKDGRHTTRLTHVSAAALRHKYAILEHELRLQKSLSEECEDLGVDSPSASELFPEAELLFAPSPAHEQTVDQCHTPQPNIYTQGIPQPDLDDQIATDQLLTHKERSDELDINLDDVGEIVTVGEDGMTTIPLDHEEFARSHEEFARSHPNTTFHSEPEDGEVPPFTIAQGAKGRQITFHSRGVPGTVVMAPQTTVISQATVEPAASQNTVKFSDIDNMINAMPSPQHAHNLNMPSVLVKDGNESLTKFDRLLNESRDMPSPNMTSNPASAIVHSTGNGTQVIRRVHFENRRDSRYLVEDSNAMIGGDTKVTEERRDLQMDENSPAERHPELFWDQSREKKKFDFNSDKCCKSPYEETNSDASGIGAHTRLDSVIKAARPERRRSDGSSAEDGHPPLRTYPAKRPHQLAHHSHHHSDVDRSLTGKTRAPDRCHDVKDESRRRASNRGVVKRGCHCCNGSSNAPKPKKSRPRKSNEHHHN